MTIYREPMLTCIDASARLGVTVRQAQTLIERHPEVARVGRLLLLPERCLPDLEQRPKRGRPRKTPQGAG